MHTLYKPCTLNLLPLSLTVQRYMRK